jgi:hypothetical protein
MLFHLSAGCREGPEERVAPAGSAGGIHAQPGEARRHAEDERYPQRSGTDARLTIAGRYPDGLPAGAPFEMFSAAHAKEALEQAKKIFVAAKKALDRGGK